MPTVEQIQIRETGTSVTPGNNQDDRKGPLRDLEETESLENLRYPIDLGTDNIYKHLMRINIYKQLKNKLKTGTLGPNAFDTEKDAGRSKVTELDNVIQGTLTAGAGALIAGAGKAVAGAADSVLGTGGLVSSAVSGLGTAATAGFAAANISGLDISRKTEKKPVAYISLYMPETLVFTDRHDFDPVSVTEALGTVGTAGNIFQGAGEASALAAQKSGLYGDGIKDVLLFGNGYSMNPQLEILYKGSKNREFVFSFKFTPRSQKEAEAVESIIKTFRFHAAPQYAVEKNASRYFIPPSEFDVEFYIGSERNTHLPRIAQCVLQNVDVNYAAAGQYSTFVDGTPVEITMQLTFTETIVLTKEDIEVGF